MKYLRVKMPDGSKWDVPARIIAANCADYFAGGVSGDAYKHEYDECLRSDSKLIDWAENNMNWDEVERHAGQVESPNEAIDHEDGWTNGVKEIVEK